MTDPNVLRNAVAVQQAETVPDLLRLLTHTVPEEDLPTYGELSPGMPDMRIFGNLTDADRLAGELQRLARRLQASEAEGGAALFTREDVDRIVSGRLAREQKRTRLRVAQLERERDELEREVEALRRHLSGS